MVDQVLGFPSGRTRISTEERWILVVRSSREEIRAGAASVCWRSLGQRMGVAASLSRRPMRAQPDFQRDEEPFSGRSMTEAGTPVVLESRWTAPGSPGKYLPVRKKSGRMLVPRLGLERLGRRGSLRMRGIFLHHLKHKVHLKNYHAIPPSYFRMVSATHPFKRMHFF